MMLRVLFQTLVGIATFLAVYAAAVIIPPEAMWFDPGDIAISDAKDGEIPIVSSTRIIKRDFLGSYSVIVRNTDNLEAVCDGRGGPFMYREAASGRPVSQLLTGWAGGGCVYQKFGPGRYQVEACWTVEHPFGILPPKTTCRLRGFTVE